MQTDQLEEEFSTLRTRSGVYTFMRTLYVDVHALQINGKYKVCALDHSAVPVL